LHARDFGAGGWSQLGDLGALWEEILEGWIGANGVLNMLEWLERSVLLVIVVDWKVVWVLGSGGAALLVDLSADSWCWSLDDGDNWCLLGHDWSALRLLNLCD